MKNLKGTEIAVIGMDGKFPDAENLRDFWKNLAEGHESIKVLQEEDLLAEGENPVTLDDPAYVRANAYMKDKQFFDAEFFGFLPDEAALMDPQMRIFLELCWSALEDAGHNLEQPAKIGLFAGGNPNVNWETYALLKNKEGLVDSYGLEHLINVSFMCSRASNVLNLQGPALHIDTACSTSLVSIQRACMSLLLRECNMALAGGITISNFTHKGYSYQEGMINSKDGHTRTFDADASGTIRGEGGGVVVLKRLADAIKDRDNIRAVIRGSGVNNDGSDKISFTAPSVDGQHKAILKALNMAGIKPETISYVEAHGTATNLGDPIEVEALNMAFGKQNGHRCAVGSVKSNIGHLSAAAGVAGLIKTILALENKKIPASLHFQKPNPKINFDNGPFFVNTELSTWQNGEYPRRAGVSSFGIGGTNAHLVLEEAPVSTSDSKGREVQLITFSAKSEKALNRNIANLSNLLADKPELKISDVAYTMNLGRTPLLYRKSVAARNREEMRSQLEALQETAANRSVDTSPEVVFMFSGQGSQYAAMGKGLYQSEPEFKTYIDECNSIYKEITGKDLTTILFPDKASANDINETQFTQPALLAVEYAMVKLLMSWGIKPDFVIGHSIGEYVAACISGLWSLQDTMSIVVKRAELMQAAPKGSMLSVSATEKQLHELLKGKKALSIAAVNSSELYVVSGAEEDIKNFESTLEKEGLKSRLLKTSHAFHSHLMDDILDDFAKAFDHVKFHHLEISLISNITGAVLSDKEAAKPEYWVKHLRQTIQFAKGAETLLSGDNRVFIEVGPGKALSTFIRAHKNRERQHPVTPVFSGPKEASNDLIILHEGLGKIWQFGVKPDWNAYYQNEERQKVSLPTYSFERVEYPVVVDARKMIRDLGGNRPDEKKTDIDSWFYAPYWKMDRKLKAETSSVIRVVTLCLSDSSALNQVVQGNFEDQKIISVSASKKFQKISTTEYQLNPSKLADFQTLFKHLAKENLLPDRVIHAWGIDSDDKVHAFYSLVSLLKAYQKSGLKDLQLQVVSSGVQAVLENAPLPSSASLMPGLLKVCAQEFPTVQTGHIDIQVTDFGHNNFDKLLAAELINESPGKVVALRGGKRFLESYQPLKVPKHSSQGFKKGATYLITGGLGPLGYHLSKYLLEEYEAKLILLGRTHVSAATKVEAKATETLTKPNRLRHLSGMGKVLYRACDVADHQLLKKTIKQAEAELGSISGIIHAAGVNEGHSIEGSLTGLQMKDFEEQLSPKLSGVLNLHRCFESRDLDFCMLTSSLSSILGGLGFGAYAPANTFLDFFARYQADENPGSWISANLDGLHFKGRSATAIDEQEIIPVFERLLTLKGQPQVIVSIKALEDRLNKWVYMETNTAEEDSEVSRSAAGLSLNDLKTEESVTNEVLALWQRFFGKLDITSKDDFFEIGGDSLKVLTMIARLHKTFDVEVPIKSFFEAPFASKIGAYIFNQKQKQGKTGFSSIPKVAIQDHYELSSAQQRLYFLYEFAPKSIAYNIPFFISLKGKFDTEKLTLAFEELINRHESLRTRFINTKGIITQQIDQHVDFELQQVGKVDSVEATVKAFVRPFVLSEAPLLRVGVGELGNDEHLLMIDVHHIISDDVSLNILFSDFISLYQNQSLPALELTYKDYAAWQQQQSESSTHKEFWLDQYNTVPKPLELPLDFKRPARFSNEGASVNFELDARQTTGLKQIGDKNGATLFMTLLSVYYLLLHKLTAQEDIVVGSPTAGRSHTDLDNIMGMFVNTLAIRNRPVADLSFSDFMKQVKDTTLTCFENQSCQFEDLIEQLNLKRSVSRNALFDVMFVFHNTDKAEVNIPGLQVAPLERMQTVAKFDLKLEGAEEAGVLQLNMDYRVKLFKHTTIKQFVDYFTEIVNAVIQNPESSIQNLIRPEDSTVPKLVKDSNDTYRELPPMESVVGRFAEQALLNPQSIAVVDETGEFTYAELDRQSDALARRLIETNEESATIGICLTSGRNVIVAILAVLKAGKGFLPLEPNLPTGRINRILEASHCQLLITEGALAESFAFEGPVVKIDAEASDQVEAVENWKDVKSTELAYVIYTSGSTGTPKGVKVSHHNLWNYFNWFVETVGINEQDRLLANSSFAFDAVYTQVFGALLSGASLHILSRNTYLEPQKLTSYIRENTISFLHMTPTLFNLILHDQAFNREALREVRTLMLGGESILTEDVRKAVAICPDIRFMNHYGPTETTIASVAQFIPTEKLDEFLNNPTIGDPIFNTQCYLLNDEGALVPPGSSGELCVAGAGIAMGYLNGGEESFVDNPFEPGTRMYKTGDICRYTESGKLEFIGRNDFQIKIRGYRVDPGEIEQQLNQFPGLSQGLVISREVSGDRQLVAYFQGGRNLTATDLKAFLSLQLPDYMVPVFYVRLDEIPLTPNGKVDRSQLPEPEIESSEAYHAPLSDIQEQLVEVWAKLLMLDAHKISTKVSFFDLGGNSMKVIQLVSRIQSAMNVSVSVVDLYEYATIEKLTEFLTTNTEGETQEQPVIEPDDTAYDQLSDAIAKFDE